MKLSNKAIKIGIGDKCPKCNEDMERRSHPKHWINKKSFFYTEWDYCIDCKHVQHYDRFKSADWQEQERQDNFMKNI